MSISQINGSSFTECEMIDAILKANSSPYQSVIECAVPNGKARFFYERGLQVKQPKEQTLDYLKRALEEKSLNVKSVNWIKFTGGCVSSELSGTDLTYFVQISAKAVKIVLEVESDEEEDEIRLPRC